ncbi:serine proteinase [Flagelloscypha sp. PMI_526]|nr:serine proteinase [Flagelloscypha sp. PMI_526]
MLSLLFIAGLSAFVAGIPSAHRSLNTRYIVTLKKADVQTCCCGELRWTIIPGFLAEGNNELYEKLFVEEDSAVELHGTVDQANASWGLVSLSAAPGSTGNGIYRYNEIAGEGADVYVVDTGVDVEHAQFGGRATLGYGATDGNGHGTAVAGVIAGTIAGVAKKASIISVKVLDDAGSGTIAGVIAGLNWIAQAAAASGRPSVVNLSLGGSASTALDNLIESGIPVVVSAGGSNTVEAGSPARVPQAITVGAYSQGGVRAPYSNYGPVIDIWAPGTGILTTWIGSTTATNTLSGTSFATAYVSGLAAYFFSVYGDVTGIWTYARNNSLSGVPSGTVNLYAHNDQNV